VIEVSGFKRLPEGYVTGDYGKPACPECGKLLSKKEIEDQECSRCGWRWYINPRNQLSCCGFLL